MNSQFESAKHREIHLKKELFRAHAIDQNNTGRVPEQVIAILAKEGHRDPGGFLSRILIGADLTGQDYRVMREINTSIIPAITPIKKPEEPKRQVKHTPPWNPSVPHVSWARIAQGAPASPAREARESDSEDYVMIDPITLRVTDRRDGVLMKKTTWQKIQELNDNGTILINRTADKWGVVIEFYPLGGGRAINHVGNVDEKIAELIKILEEKRIPGISIKRETEPQKPATVRIYLETLEEFSSGNKASGIEVSTETLGKIQKLRKLGELTVKVHQEDQFRFRFMPSEVGGPHTSYGYTLDEAMQKLWGYLQEIGKVRETPSDMVKFDIDDVQECTGTGPGVVTIPRKTLNDIITLQQIGRFQIFAEEKEGLFTVNFYDQLQYATKTDIQGSIEEAVAQILEHAQNCGYYDHIFRSREEKQEIPQNHVKINLKTLRQTTDEDEGEIIDGYTLRNIRSIEHLRKGSLSIHKTGPENFEVFFKPHGKDYIRTQSSTISTAVAQMLGIVKKIP